MWYSRLILAFLIYSILPSGASAAGAYRYDDGNGTRGVVGFQRGYTVGKGETLYDIARMSGLGIEEIADANAGVDKIIPGVGRRIVLPTAWVLPMSAQSGIVINLAEMRLYRFAEDGLVSSYPVGIGVDGFETPEGEFVVSEKLVAPTWYPPESIRQEDPTLPFAVGQGEENPLGEFALRLSDTNYFIHGTNKPLGVGMRISHGCIRLYPEDIKALFPLAGIGTPVKIVYQPVKFGMKGRDIYIEVHEDFIGRYKDLREYTGGLIQRMGLAGLVDEALLSSAVNSRSGVPVRVGRAHGDVYAVGEKKPPLEEEASKGSP